jgi:hypothetical protein
MAIKPVLQTEARAMEGTCVQENTVLDQRHARRVGSYAQNVIAKGVDELWAVEDGGDVFDADHKH